MLDSFDVSQILLCSNWKLHLEEAMRNGRSFALWRDMQVIGGDRSLSAGPDSRHVLVSWICRVSSFLPIINYIEFSAFLL